MINPVTLGACPAGLFLFGECLGFKSEYRTASAKGFPQSDAYVVSTGEYFWGGTSKSDVREKLLVLPLRTRTLETASTGELFNALLTRIDFDGMDPRTFSLAELQRAIKGAEWPAALSAANHPTKPDTQ